MNRRGFMNKLGSVFSREGDDFFFGLQIAINVYGEDVLRRNLHGVLADDATIESPADKRAYYKRIVALLMENQPFFEYGFWDFLTKPGEAEAEFNEWVTELQGSIATEEEELGDEIDEMHRMSSDKSYVVVTLLFLLENHEALNPFFQRINSIEEDDYFSRSGFNTLIDALNYLEFDFILGDASFIMPGNQEDGISWEDIHGEGWHYIKPIMGV